MPLYHVRYKVTYEGYTQVEAADTDEALDLVNSGEFTESPKQEKVDWIAEGRPVLAEN